MKKCNLESIVTHEKLLFSNTFFDWWPVNLDQIVQLPIKQVLKAQPYTHTYSHSLSALYHSFSVSPTFVTPLCSISGKSSQSLSTDSQFSCASFLQV